MKTKAFIYYDTFEVIVRECVGEFIAELASDGKSFISNSILGATQVNEKLEARHFTNDELQEWLNEVSN